MVERRNDIHLDRGLHHHIYGCRRSRIASGFSGKILPDIIYNHVVHLHQAAVGLELFRLVFRNHQVSGVGVSVHSRAKSRIHNELHVVNGNSPGQYGLFCPAVVNESAVETHQVKSGLHKAVLFCQLLDAGQGPPRGHHELVTGLYHLADGGQIFCGNILVVVQQGSVQVGKQDFHDTIILQYATRPSLPGFRVSGRC